MFIILYHIIRLSFSNNIILRVYKSYQEVEQDFASGMLDPSELKQSLYELLTGISEPIREHFHGSKNKKNWFGFLKFFTGGKQQTASLHSPK